jgi:hypothetical protein
MENRAREARALPAVTERDVEPRRQPKHLARVEREEHAVPEDHVEPVRLDALDLVVGDERLGPKPRHRDPLAEHRDARRAEQDGQDAGKRERAGAERQRGARGRRRDAIVGRGRERYEQRRREHRADAVERLCEGAGREQQRALWTRASAALGRSFHRHW